MTKVVGRFKLVREIGGRPGTWAARRSDAELVVIHRVPAAGRAASLVGEARRAIDVEHPCIVRVRSVEATGPDVLIASDFVDGEMYSALVDASRERGEPISLAVTLRVLCDVLSALAAMHDAIGASGRRVQLVFGRLAPVDVIVGVDGVARVVLGARWSRAEETSILGYVAPEIVLGGEADADERSDVYAVGVMLWEALAGRRLHDVTTTDALLARQLRGRIAPPPVSPSTEWAAPIGAIAARALAADPKDRFVSAAAMLEALLEVAGRRIGTANDLANVVESLAGPFIRARRREVSSLAASDSDIRTTRDEDRLAAHLAEPDEVKTEVDFDVQRVHEAMRQRARAEQAVLIDEDADEPRTEVEVPFRAPVHPADLEPTTRPADVPQMAPRTVPRPGARGEDPSLTSTIPPAVRQRLLAEEAASLRGPPDEEEPVTDVKEDRRNVAKDDPYATETVTGMRPKVESITIEPVSRPDAYAVDASITAKRPSPPDSLPVLMVDQAELYDTDTATVAKKALLPFLVEQTVRMPRPDEVKALAAKARTGTAPLGIPVLSPRPADEATTERIHSQSAIAAVRAAIAESAPSASRMNAAHVITPPNAPAISQSSPNLSAPNLSNPMKTSAPPSSPSSSASKLPPTVSIRPRRERGSFWLGFVTFLLVLASLGLLAWFTFPMWRHWVRI